MNAFEWEHVLYRLFDAERRLLYVGITGSVQRRLKSHSQTKPWWPEVADMKIEFYSSRIEVQAAEARAIRREVPQYNITHQARAPKYTYPALETSRRRQLRSIEPGDPGSPRKEMQIRIDSEMHEAMMTQQEPGDTMTDTVRMLLAEAFAARGLPDVEW